MTLIELEPSPSLYCSSSNFQILRSWNIILMIMDGDESNRTCSSLSALSWRSSAPWPHHQYLRRRRRRYALARTSCSQSHQTIILFRVVSLRRRRKQSPRPADSGLGFQERWRMLRYIAGASREGFAGSELFDGRIAPVAAALTVSIAKWDVVALARWIPAP